MLTLKKLLKDMPKLEVAPTDYSKWVNGAYEHWFEHLAKQCIVCHKSFKTAHGMLTHRGRVHKYVAKLYNIAFRTDPSVPRGAIRVGWDKTVSK